MLPFSIHAYAKRTKETRVPTDYEGDVPPPMSAKETEHFAKFFKELGVSMDTGGILTDKFGRIGLWHLPDIIHPLRVVRPSLKSCESLEDHLSLQRAANFATSKLNDLVTKEGRGVEKGGDWRTQTQYLQDKKKSILNAGAINLVSMWFEQGKDVS